jgi:hypothetical protein
MEPVSTVCIVGEYLGALSSHTFTRGKNLERNKAHAMTDEERWKFIVAALRHDPANWQSFVMLCAIRIHRE